MKLGYILYRSYVQDEAHLDTNGSHLHMQAVHIQLSASRTCTLTVRAQAEEVQQDDGGSGDASGLVSQFGGNSKFASVLAAALQRSGGEEVLTSGPERIEEP